MAQTNWQAFLSANLGKILGILLGLFLGWLVIHYGFFKTVFVLIMVAIGYFLGKQLDEGDSLGALINRIFKK